MLFDNILLKKKSFIYSSFFIIVTLVYLVIRMHLPLTIACNQVYDDALFIKNAESISNGDWLGEFNHLTLVKGPVFSLFLSLNNLIGVPVTLSIALFYAVACWFFVFSLRFVGMPLFFGFLLYLLLLYQPVLIPTRVARDNIYTSLILVVFAASLLVVSKKAPFWNAILCGLALSAFFMTREEGIWIIPGMLVLCAGAFFQFRSGFYSDWNPVKKFLVPLVLFACFFVPIQIVSTINYIKYDYYGIVDIKAKGFRATLDAVQSVVLGDPIPFLPAPAAARAEIYKYSPAFAELRDILENEKNPFKNVLAKLYPHTANDIPGGWFLWAFRDAVAKRGYYKNGATAETFYSRIAAEIHAAQKEGLLPKKTSPIPLMPPISRENLSQIPKSFSNAFKFLLYQIPIQPNGGPSVGSAVQLQRISSFLGNPKAMPPENLAGTVRVHGWYVPKNGGWLELRGNSGDFSEAKLRRMPSPDLEKAFKNSKLSHNRFSFEAKRDGDQYLQSDTSEWRVQIQNLVLQKSGIVDFGGGKLAVDVVEDIKFPELESKGLSAKKNLLDVYKAVTPVLFFSSILALFAITVVLLFKRVKSPPNWILVFAGISMVVLFFCRILLVVLVDISSFPAIGESYLSSGFPWLPAFAMVCFSVLLQILSSKPNVH